jgi:hypothetical protein
VVYEAELGTTEENPKAQYTAAILREERTASLAYTTKDNYLLLLAIHASANINRKKFNGGAFRKNS